MSVWLWIGFVALILLLLALDLGVFHRDSRTLSAREALGWTMFWVSLAIIFNSAIYFMYEKHWVGIGLSVGHPLSGRQAAVQFFTAYLVEQSLSLDNMFVIALIFAYFRVPSEYQRRVLFWGVLGALVMRGIMIGAGIAFIQRFEWMVYVFGALLIFTAVKMITAKEDNVAPERNPLVRIVQRWYPVTSEYHAEHFFVKVNGRRMATPLCLALVIVESSDLLFAVDSIPAVFAITLDPFIVFTSNIFAILGLRSLYFALATMLDRFTHLKISLVFVLAFVGVKMLLTHHFSIRPLISLAVILAILLIGIVASLREGARGRLRHDH